MSWPTGSVNLTNVDAGTDDPSLARADIKDAFDKINLMIPAQGAADGVASLDSSSEVPAAELAKALLKTGGTMTGDITLAGAPTASLHPATKLYTDNLVPDAMPAATNDDDVAYVSSSAWVAGVPPWAQGMNFFVNGSTNVWQNQVTFAAIANGQYSADQYYCSVNGVEQLVLQHERSTDVPTVAQAGRLHEYSVKVSSTTAETAYSIDDYVGIGQWIEGYNIQPLMGQTMTLSFWCRSTRTGQYSIHFSNNTGTRVRAENYSISATNTWEFKTITMAMEDGLTGTWESTNSPGLLIHWTLFNGSDYDITAGSWQTVTAVDGLGTSSDINNWGLANTDTYFLTGVELVLGSKSGVSRPRTFQEELFLCQRYSCHSYTYGTYPGAATTVGSIRAYSDGHTNSNHTCITVGEFPVPMRTVPTVTTYAQSGNASVVDMVAGEVTPSTVSPSTTSVLVTAVNGAASTVRNLAFSFFSDARM